MSLGTFSGRTADGMLVQAVTLQMADVLSFFDKSRTLCEAPRHKKAPRGAWLVMLIGTPNGAETHVMCGRCFAIVRRDVGEDELDAAT